MEKDPRLADAVIRALLRFWPLTNSHKEVLFLGELEEVLELTQARFTKYVFIFIYYWAVPGSWWRYRS